MAFKQVASLDADTTVSLGKADEKGKTTNSVEGYYLGFRTTTNSYGDSSLHVFQTSKGNVGVWGSTNMDQKLKGVKPGTMTRVTAAGLAPKKPGKNPMKLFNVEVDAANTIEVEGNAAESFDTGEDVEYDAEEENTEVDYEETSYAATPPSVPRGLTAKERADKVQALLKGNKKIS